MAPLYLNLQQGKSIEFQITTYVIIVWTINNAWILKRITPFLIKPYLNKRSTTSQFWASPHHKIGQFPSYKSTYLLSWHQLEIQNELDTNQYNSYIFLLLGLYHKLYFDPQYANYSILAKYLHYDIFHLIQRIQKYFKGHPYIP